MEENVRICDICGCEIKEEEGTWVDDQFLCHECVDEHCTTCDHCGETIWINDAVQDWINVNKVDRKMGRKVQIKLISA